MKIKIIDSGFQDFFSICQKGKIEIKDIEELINNDSYNRVIELMGNNWGIGSHKEWKELFQCALCYDHIDNLSSIQSLYVNHIKKAKNSLTKLLEFNNRIKSILESKRFFEIVNQYSYLDDLDTITIHLLIFGPNAGGNKELTLDLLFLESFSDEEISKIIAHELHHMIRSKYEVIYNSEYQEINQMLFWLESEGCANLCNYETTQKIYEIYGYVEKESMNKNLENIKEHIHNLSNLIIKVYENTSVPNELYTYLANNLLFHTLGYYMAQTIYQFSNTSLKETVGNPLLFINKYQEICTKENIGHSFSDDAIKVVNKVLSQIH